MKRALLIGTGSVCSLGAVLLITPPQIGSSAKLLSTGGLSIGGSSLSTGTSLSSGTSNSSTAATSSNTSASSTNTSAAASATTASTGASTTGSTTAATTKKKSAKKKKTSKKATSASAASASAGTNTSTSVASTSSNSTSATSSNSSAAGKSSGVSGTFTGQAAQTFYGAVQVEITISNGKITAARALTYPTESFRDQQINQQAIPYLVQETLQAQSANIQGVGGASYTTQGWIASLQSALTKAGY